MNKDDRKRYHYYSGPNSKKFWEMVNAYKDSDSRFSLLYLAGCALQDHETRVHQMLQEMAKYDAQGNLRSAMYDVMSSTHTSTVSLKYAPPKTGLGVVGA